MAERARARLHGTTLRLLPLATGLTAVAGTFLLAGLLLALGGYDPVEVFGALARGAAGSPRRFASITLVRTVPLLLTGLAVALAFRAGVWNIGAEGQLYAGAVAATAVGLAGGGLPAAVLVPSVVAAALLAGAAWAAIPAFMKLRLGVGEVITTLLLNFVAIDLTAWLVRGPLQESRGVFPQSDAVAEAARLPAVFPGSRLHAGFVLAVGLALLLWLVLRFTRAGFMIRAVGASPAAAEVSGRIPAARVTAAVFLASGALAGLAGGVEVAGVTHALYEDLSPGHGYTAIAVALLAGLHPMGVLFTALFFGALEAGAGAVQREVGVPAAWVGGLEALVILGVLAADRVVARGAPGRRRLTPAGDREAVAAGDGASTDRPPTAGGSRG